jgi:hypothetical protein
VRFARSGCRGDVGGGRPVPRQQIVDAVHFVIGDAPEEVPQVGERIDAGELAGFDQAVDRRGAVAAGVGAGEQPVLAAEGNRPVILPMSGRNSSSTTAGTRFMGVASGGNTASNG